MELRRFKAFHDAYWTGGLDGGRVRGRVRGLPGVAAGLILKRMTELQLQPQLQELGYARDLSVGLVKVALV